MKICWKEKFSLFDNFIRDYLLNGLSLDSELDLWETYCITYKRSLPDNVPNTLKSIKFLGFQNIKVALRIIGTLPVTSCESARSFSALGRLKTYIRSPMAAERLNGLSLLHVHKDITANIGKVTYLYAMKNRRLTFYWINILINEVHLGKTLSSVTIHSVQFFKFRFYIVLFRFMNFEIWWFQLRTDVFWLH